MQSFLTHTIYRDSRRRSFRVRNLLFCKEPLHENNQLPSDSVAVTCYFSGETISIDGIGTNLQETPQVGPLNDNWEHSMKETIVGDLDVIRKLFTETNFPLHVEITNYSSKDKNNYRYFLQTKFCKENSSAQITTQIV
jgi:hypothetical protein